MIENKLKAGDIIRIHPMVFINADHICITDGKRTCRGSNFL